MPRNRFAHRLLVTFGLFLALMLGAQSAFASHFRYGTMYWVRDLTYANPNKPNEVKITLTIEGGWRWGYPFPVAPNATLLGPVSTGGVAGACTPFGAILTAGQATGSGSCPPIGAAVNPTGGVQAYLNFSAPVTIVATNYWLPNTAPLAVTATQPGTTGYPFYARVQSVSPTQDTAYMLTTIDMLVDTAVVGTTANPLLVTWQDCCRLNANLDGNINNWRLQTAIDLSPGNTKSPRSVSTPIVQVISGVTNTVTLPVITFDNKIATFRLATVTESQLAAAQPASPSTFTLDAAAGTVSFKPRTTGLYSVQFKVGASDGTTTTNEVPLDLIFQAVTGSASTLSLATSDGQTTYTGTVPNPLSFAVKATLTPPATASQGYTVTINHGTLPTGATFTQPASNGSSPAVGTFTWTPTVSSTASVTCFTATATLGQVLIAQTLNQLCVTVNLNPLETVLTAAPANGHGGGPLVMSATLTRKLDGAPLGGRAINFAWSDPNNPPWVADCPPIFTGANGVATCTVQTNRIIAAAENGTYNATFNAIANELLTSSSASGSVVLKTATTSLDPATAGSASLGYPLTVSAVLHRIDTDGGLFPPPGEAVQFTLTDPNGTQSVLTGVVTGSQGVASVTFPADATPVLGNYTVDAYFATDALLIGNVSSTASVTMGQRMKLTTAPATGGATLPTPLRARLTTDPQGTPVSGKVVSITFGTTTLQGTTDADGWAQVMGTFPNIGTSPFGASYTPDLSLHELNRNGTQTPETATGTATMTPAVVTVVTTSAFAGTAWTPAMLAAHLATQSPNAPISGVAIAFAIGGVTAGTATTDASGTATLALTPSQSVTSQYTASYAGLTNVYLASSSSSSYVIANAASTTAISCAGPVTFNGFAQAPCSATVTGAGGLSQSVNVTYTNNVGAGTATAAASFAGDSSHDSSTASTTFAIAMAPSATVVTCPSTPVPFNGTAQTVCSATVTGDGGLSQSVPVSYAGNTDAGVASASASFAGDANHTASTALAANFTIVPAGSATTITCPAAPLTFTGAAQTPCTATVTGIGGLNQPVAVTYANNANVGNASATAQFAGDGNHTASTGTGSFSIGLAATTTTVTCPLAPVTFTGTALTPCTATVTGAGGLSQSVSVSYSANTNVGPVTATAQFDGDANHSPSSGSGAFAIGVAGSTTTVVCQPASVTFNGAAQTPCTATVTGSGGLNQSLSVSYVGNVAAGSASATASFAGDANHASSDGSATFAIAKAASTTVVVCSPASVTFTGAAQTPCTATVTGDGGLNAPLSVSYTDNVNAGSVTASASYAGDGNHSSSASTAAFNIGKAASTTVVTCSAASLVFNGAAQTPCAASVTGDGGLNQSLTVSYSGNLAAGSASATASFAGDANHDASNGSTTFAITKAASTTAVVCAPASVAFNGAAQTPCSATVTGDGGLSQVVSVSYINNTGAGTASASAAYAGDANHDASNGSATFAITKAASTTAVVCAPASVTFNGAAQTPCAATVTGDGGLSQVVSVSYVNNTGAGTASASAAYAGDANHDASNGSASFTIGKALTTTTLTCPASVTFTGSALTPCTASVAGGGGLSQPVAVGYGSNTSAGTASANASFAGDANYQSSNAAATFAIAKASASIAVTCPASVTYNGSAQSPCSAALSGAGGLSQPVTVGYQNNINAGTATASASFVGDANHDAAAGSATFAIGKASSSVAMTCPATVTYNGSAQTPCTASVSGVGGLSQALSVGYQSNTGAGTATANASYAGDLNHVASNGTTTFAIAKATPSIVWPSPTAISYGVALSGAQLDATSPVAGTFVYTPAPGTVLLAGPQTLSVVFTPTNGADYVGASASVTLTVNAASASSLETLVSAVVTDPSTAASLNHTLGQAGSAPNGASRAAHLNKFVRDVNNLVPRTLTQAQANLLIQVANTLY